MERIRQQNSGSSCTAPGAAAPGGFASWDAWLADTSTNGGGGKSVESNQAGSELVVLTASGTDPVTVTVAMCWRHRGRVIGECTWNGSALVADESLAMASDTTAIDSPAMLSTLMTCRK
jgi:hypothetical protein